MAVSIHLMLLLIRRPVRLWLSPRRVSIHLMLLLIIERSHWFLRWPSFNTSHVTINLVNQRHVRHVDDRFNTSHVTINPATWTGPATVWTVSIHLMLLLIIQRGALPVNVPVFQYISCYY